MDRKPKKLFRTVGNTPVVPLSFKIMSAFVILLLLATFSTNYLNLVLNQRELVVRINELLVKELKEVYLFASSQHDIFLYSGDKAGALSSISENTNRSLLHPGARAFGMTTRGEMLFEASNGAPLGFFPDQGVLEEINALKVGGTEEGSIRFNGPGGEYFGVYKYLDKWDAYVVRAELYSQMVASTNRIFVFISLIILFLTAGFIAVGLLVINHILRFVQRIADGMLSMQNNQQLEVINLDGAPNDDVTYLGASFNTLSVTINNLMGIFRKFVTQDVVQRAYKEHKIKLEGKQMDLAILFSDIRGFTYMTETLGNDIIDLLNVHYDRAITCVHSRNGIVGSIIGDAVLAVYGTLQDSTNKSLEAIESAYSIQSVTAALREQMKLRRSEIEQTRPLTAAEERVFKAVLIDVGVGIDGGTVFYGNIGSVERMTNTVIGDNVNAASRLEGLTRIYHVPIICSTFIKEEVEQATDRYRFIELDMVQVKGKTEGKKIFFPFDTKTAPEEALAHWERYSQALELYYAGNWDEARTLFNRCSLEVCEVFRERLGMNEQAPQGWRGIWTMTTK